MKRLRIFLFGLLLGIVVAGTAAHLFDRDAEPNDSGGRLAELVGAARDTALGDTGEDPETGATRAPEIPPEPSPGRTPSRPPSVSSRELRDHGDEDTGRRGSELSGSKGAVEQRREGSAASASKPVFTARPERSATLSGRARFEGAVPPRVRIVMEADPICAAANGGQPVFKDELVLHDDRTIRNVLVYADPSSRALAPWSFAVPTEPALLEMFGCMFRPHVFGVVRGQTIRFRNGDETTFNVKANPRRNRGFNFSQPRRGMEDTQVFDVDEFNPPFRIEDNVHPWMSAYCAVFPHPYFAVTGDDGTFRIPDLPPGEYEFAAWHESERLFGAGRIQMSSVTLESGKATTLDFVFQRVDGSARR